MVIDTPSRVETTFLVLLNTEPLTLKGLPFFTSFPIVVMGTYWRFHEKIIYASVFSRGVREKKTQIANMIKGAGNSISSKERIWTCNRREKDFEIKGKGWFLGTHSEWDR